MFREDGILWSKAVIFEKRQDFVIESGEVEYSQVDDAIYFDGQFCYESVNDSRGYRSFTLGVLNLIAVAIGKRFDSLP